MLYRSRMRAFHRPIDIVKFVQQICIFSLELEAITDTPLKRIAKNREFLRHFYFREIVGVNIDV